MEFNEKLQKLRKEKKLTQDELANALFVSRTAISKWETNKGYPNLETLKSIATFFDVTIDELLSGEEIIKLAKDENQNNLKRIYQLIFSFLDITMILLFILPVFGQREINTVKMVNLFSLEEVITVQVVYIGVTIFLIILGMSGVILQQVGSKGFNIYKYFSLIIQFIIINILIGTQQPYATSLVFLLFILKVIILVKIKESPKNK